MAHNVTRSTGRLNRSEAIEGSSQETRYKMATHPATKPENMLPIMIVLGIMFLGICIAMNLFSRARFKKRTNAFAVAGRATPSRRTNRGPGSIHRLESFYSPSPLPVPSATGQVIVKSSTHSGTSSFSAPTPTKTSLATGRSISPRESKTPNSVPC